jgi:subtilisin family serine protease
MPIKALTTSTTMLTQGQVCMSMSSMDPWPTKPSLKIGLEAVIPSQRKRVRLRQPIIMHPMWAVSNSCLLIDICYDGRIDIYVTIVLMGFFLSGTIGSKTYGVAKQVTIYSLRVLSNQGSGSWTDVISAIDFLISEKKNDPSRKMVANMSLGGGSYSPVDDAVNKAVAAGVIMVVAAGNDNINACNTSPAAASGAITVGATTSADAKAGYSNYGPCVDIFAPGTNIISLSQKQGQTIALSGTSMATPHVVGVIALYLEAGKTVADVLNDASVGVISGVGSGSPNKFLAVKLANPNVKAPTKSPTKAPVSPPANVCLPVRAACTRAAQCCSGRCRRNLCRQA